MAKISAKKSDLKTIANKIIVSPSTAAVSDLKFKRKKDFSTFVKWIDSSNKALAGGGINVNVHANDFVLKLDNVTFTDNYALASGDAINYYTRGGNNTSFIITGGSSIIGGS